MPLTYFLAKVEQQRDLSRDEAYQAFEEIFEGRVSSEQISAFLIGLHNKGETVDELLGAVTSMRSKAVTINSPPGTIDIVGTGGDGLETLNISTAVALVVASCGVPVAKHGNRSASSRSGSSDVLTALGVNLDVSSSILEESLHDLNICFLFAPNHHPAMRHVADVRKRLKIRTIFNLLGPLTNPANVKHHLIGVYDLEWLGPMAEVLKSLGSESAWLVHGHDGMDEITTTAPTDIVQLNHAMISHFTLKPEDLRIKTTLISELKGGDALYNAELLRQLLKGTKGAYRDIVAVNSSAALVVSGKAPDLQAGLKLAESALDHGTAELTLNRLIQLTNGKIP